MGRRTIRATMILPRQITLGDVFDSAGYRTGFIGKLHNGGQFWNRAGTDYTADPDAIDFARPFDAGPTGFGFDYSFLLPGGFSGTVYAYFENDRLVRYTESSGSYEAFAADSEARSHMVRINEAWGGRHNTGLMGSPGLAMDNFDSSNTGRVLARKALEFMGRAIDENTSPAYPQPFFLFFAMPELHTPYSPPAFFDIDHADDVTQPKSGTAVAGSSGIGPDIDMVKEIDLIVGELTRYLEERGQLENTLIILTSDNGPVVPPGQQDFAPQGTEGGVPLRGYKGTIFEGGHRVPLLARWGSGAAGGSIIPPQSRSDALVGLHDLMATFYALLGVQRPHGQANDSKSFLPVLLGSEQRLAA